MANEIVDYFNANVREILIYQTSELFGESKESIQEAVNSIFPALMGALIMKGNTEHGARTILDYMAANNITHNILHDLPNVLSGGPEVEILKANGADILKFLAQDKVSSMIDSISASHSLRTSSASSLLKVVGTLMMIVVAHVVETRHLNASGLRELLQSHVDYVKDSPEHSINEIVGPWTHVFPSRVAHGVMHIENEEPADNRSLMSKLLPWIILLIAALGLFYFLNKGSAL